MNVTAFTVLIPARLGSTRLPAKALKDLAGRPMVLHVVDRALESGAAAVHVATDDPRIIEACAESGAGALMTRSDHPSGTDRLAEACDLLGLEDGTIVVNLQGDEPLMPPQLIRQVARLLDDVPDADMASLCHPITGARDLFDPNVVKVVCDAAGRALYFSRAPIPWNRARFADDRGDDVVDGHLRHIGLYAYRAGFLRRYVRMEPAPAERLEALEQLRALHHGATVAMGVAAVEPGPGVDTEADLERARAALSRREPPR